jgi:predicted phosphodiesterase
MNPTGQIQKCRWEGSGITYSGKPLIGIMADSHGQSETIEAALRVLEDRECRIIYHLGDVCDSNYPETVGACLRSLRAHNVITIKGNNDHTVVANSLSQANPPVSREVLQYFDNLPLIKFYKNAVFAHSLPFVRELGLSSMIGAMGQAELKRFFTEFPKHILFRGHSHSPEIVWSRDQDIQSRSLAAGERYNITAKIPCVVTCGALTRRLCLVWNNKANTVECLSFN